MNGFKLLARSMLALAVTVAFLLVGNHQALADSADPFLPEWNNTGVDTGGTVEIPGSGGDQREVPSSQPKSGVVFEARLACADGDIVIFPECAVVMPECAAGAGSKDGKAGTAIYWYFSDTRITPAVWVFHSGPVCVFGEKPRDLLAEIAGLIAHEFQRTPVAAAEFGSQPGPHTLRGKETNVWAEAKTQTFNLTLLGQKVVITATPAAYTWSYGDGTIWGPTPIHGAPLHTDRIGEQTQTSHVYTETGRLAINLTTHFNGSYSVNGGPDLPIPGQGSIPSSALPLTVWRAETHLYADDCFVNPHGVGC
ncbi:hypothetical protein [Arthrobacter psychrochitiniphilus]|uniref:hypothetical protein n=1 Tax=Arthrobacter psychrochitiniphilus TaxID=291045 RepID=UPI001FEB2F9D|nr:hypothetical protein [Arthrobacter psychrochitiniphilus]